MNKSEKIVNSYMKSGTPEPKNDTIGTKITLYYSTLYEQEKKQTTDIDKIVAQEISGYLMGLKIILLDQTKVTQS